ncbi:amidase [Gemmata sp.]|uniref:amidase n=1 Tax=Gemmata sp. TaxID=1914242 RepID=UPI003F71ECF9
MPEPTTITAAAGFIRTGDLTPVELLDQCVARIERYEDRVHAWAYLDLEGAREQAERLTAELKTGQNRGPLHGVPVGIKDIIDVFDMPTGCGSKGWANSYARRDATCVERLRQSGAIILGKTVTTAYASFDPPVTRNPWNLDRTPGGSSSGSAAAVACGMCLGALASQTGGSITRPASYCGVYSIKPTYRRVSVDGVLPLAPSLDHVGAMANCVRDLAILLQPLARTNDDPKDSPPVPYHYESELSNEMYHDRRRRLSLLPGFPATAVPEMNTAIATLRKRTDSSLPERTETNRWEWNELPLPPSFSDVPRFQHLIMAVEAAAYHGERMRRHPDDYPPNVRRLIEMGLSTPAPQYVRAKQLMEHYREESEPAFVDNWRTFLTPAATGPAPSAETTGSPAFNSPWSYTGLPTVSLPVAWTADGLPLAVQLTGERWCEDDLLAVAAMLEADIGFERRPLPL